MARGRRRRAAPSPQQIIDAVASNMIPPILYNGIYTFSGNQMSFRAHADTVPVETDPSQLAGYQPMMMQAGMMQPGMLPPDMVDNNMMQVDVAQQQSNQMLTNMIQVGPASTGKALQQANITIAGIKTKGTNQCCIASTIILGGVCIFPLCFMCCDWWKKIAHPTYEISIETYNDIGRFINKNSTMNNLTLTVADNSFNAEKANILAESIRSSRLTGFTFLNIAVPLNHLQNEANDFINNAAPIKSLGIATSLTWRDMIA